MRRVTRRTGCSAVRRTTGPSRVPSRNTGLVPVAKKPSDSVLKARPSTSAVKGRPMSSRTWRAPSPVITQVSAVTQGLVLAIVSQ